MPDKTLTCRDCGAEFVFTEGEQAFYLQKGFTNEPTRCPSCRAARKSSRSEGSSSGTREMFPAVCAQCGKATQVPFQPRTDRPVYCSECYAAQRGSGYGERRSGSDRRSRDRDRGDRW